MQLQQRMLQHSIPALPSRLHVDAPLSERGRYVTGNRHVCRMNDSGDSSVHDVINGGCGGRNELGVKRRRILPDTADAGPNEPYSGIFILRRLYAMRQCVFRNFDFDQIDIAHSL